jgi:membrane-bound metal-dependent hydrolase YbcI (DUF457 family)
MPFTPYHFGPGLLVKGIAARWYSWTAFIAAQVVIDCETLYYLSRQEYPLHRKLHTLIGAAVAGLATAAALLGIRWLARRAAPQLVDTLRLSRPSIQAESSTVGILVGGFVGGVSHPLLDGLMHMDIKPFLPWTDRNPLLEVIGVEALHQGCEITGVIGLVLMGIWLYVESRAG